MFECTVRYSKENPWEGFDLWRAWMPDVTLRSGVGSNRIGTFGMTLLDHLLTLKRPRRVHVRRPDGEFTLSRDR
jgi:hypothetical protein